MGELGLSLVVGIKGEIAESKIRDCSSKIILCISKFYHVQLLE